MAGNGQVPFQSAWTSSSPQRPRSAAILYPQINFGDTNADEGTLWDNWFFGSGGFLPAWAAGSNLPVIGTGTY